EPLVDAGKLRAGGARRDRGDRLRPEQRLSERLRRADVGFYRTGANRYADADPSDVGGGSGHKRTHAGVVPNIAGHDAEIEWNAARRRLDEFRGRAVANDGLVAGRALEQGGDLVERAGDAAPRDDLKLQRLDAKHYSQRLTRAR